MIVAGDHDLAALAVEGRDLMAPPELTRDAPILDVLEPVEVGLRPLLRDDLGAAVFDRSDGRLGEGRHFHEPLRADHGLDHGVAALTARQHQRVGLSAPLQALLGQRSLHGLARLFHGLALEAAALGVDAAVQVQDVDLGELVALARRKVVEVVGRRHLHGAGAEGHVHQDGVGDDGDLAIDEGVLQHLAVQVPVARIVGVNRDGGVAQHGLGSRRRDYEFGHPGAGIGVGNRIRELVELALRLLVLDLEIAERGATIAAPVDEARRSVDEPVLVEPNEALGHRPAQVRVHGELGALPVGGAAEGAHLLGDAAAALLLPLPDALDEFLASEIVAAQVLSAQLALDHGLGGDAGVIDARLPERIFAEHALVANERVFEGAHQRVAHVQGARDVGRRQRDDVHGTSVVGVDAGSKHAFGLPELVPAGLDVRGLVGRG